VRQAQCQVKEAEARACCGRVATKGGG